MPVRSPPHLATLVALTALSVATLNMFLPSLANIAAELEAGYALVSLSIGGYLAVTAVVALIAGPLSDRYGRRPVLLASMTLFTAASLGCALAEDIGTFLFFRLFQAAMASGQALSLAIVRDTRRPEEAASIIGYISMAMALAPMLGPVIGGFLDEAFGWRATFWLYTLAGAAMLAIVWVDLGETRHPHEAGGLREPSHRLLGEPLFWAYALCTMFSLGGFFIFLTGAPLVAQTTFGVGAADLGLFIGSISGGFMAGSFVSGRLARRVRPWVLILTGRLLAFCGLFAGLVLILAGYVTPLTFFGSTMFAGIGNGLTLPNSNARVMSVRPALIGTASGWSAALSVAGGAVLTTITGMLVPAEGGAPVLMALMLVSAAAALLAILWAVRIETRAPLPA